MKLIRPSVFSDTKIDGYVHAPAEVARISQSGLERLASTRDKKQAREMQGAQWPTSRPSFTRGA